MLVDDEPSIRWTMAELLKRGGYETMTAQDFDSAIAAVESNEPDAAVVDIILPGKSGIEFLKRMSNREPYLPVIMVTGEPNISQIPEIVRAGAYDFISKPVVKEVLLNAVSRAVEKKRLVEEKSRLEQQVLRHAEELEQQVAERTSELARAHNFLNTVLDSSTEYAIIATDKQGLITLFNRGAELMTGYEANQVLGKPVEDLIRGDEDGARDKLFLDYLCESEAKGRHQVEVELGRADGSRFAACAAITPIRRSGDESFGFLSIIKDLTEERQSEEALRQMQARLAHNEKISALGRMAAQVAHEVKNPLAGLRLYSMHLKSKVAGQLPATELSLVDKIIDGINHLSDTVEQVLSFARPVNLNRRAADLNHIVTTAAQLLEPQINAGKIDVRLKLTESGAPAALDEAAMRSTVINLMLNAIQAMKEGGKLQVSTTKTNGTVYLEIEDTGCGMTREQIKNVFEPFYTTRSKGLGLGMFQAWKTIEQHGGTILIDSQVDKGTRIKISLPQEGIA